MKLGSLKKTSLWGGLLLHNFSLTWFQHSKPSPTWYGNYFIFPFTRDDNIENNFLKKYFSNITYTYPHHNIIFLENKQKVPSKKISCKIKRKFHIVKCLSFILSMKDIKKSFIYFIFIHFEIYGSNNETKDMVEC